MRRGNVARRTCNRKKSLGLPGKQIADLVQYLKSL